MLKLIRRPGLVGFRFDRQVRCFSTAVLGGGFTRPRCMLKLEVQKGYRGMNPAADIQAAATLAGAAIAMTEAKVRALTSQGVCCPITAAPATREGFILAGLVYEAIRQSLLRGNRLEPARRQRQVACHGAVDGVVKEEGEEDGGAELSRGNGRLPVGWRPSASGHRPHLEERRSSRGGFPGTKAPGQDRPGGDPARFRCAGDRPGLGLGQSRGAAASR